MPRIDVFLQLAREQGGSDIHLTVGLPPMLRLEGRMSALKYRELDAAETADLLGEIIPPGRKDELARRGAIDVCYSAAGIGRFRINIYRQSRGMAAACRVIAERAPRLADLGLPPVVTHFTQMRSGLVLVTGGVGTGKSTTLAAMIEEINQTRSATILTLEDPIEVMHQSKQSLIVQREVGTHVPSFAAGLHAGLREDPDIILVGELRDPETIALAVEASETGHLVLGTLHTRGAYQTIHRITDAFPAGAQAQIRHTLAENLKAVVSQELLRTFDGRGRRAAVEVLVVNAAIAQLIRESKTHQIPSAIATGRRFGMQLLDQALLAMVKAGEIDPDDAFNRATEKQEFARFVTQPELRALAETAVSTLN